MLSFWFSTHSTSGATQVETRQLKPNGIGLTLNQWVIYLFVCCLLFDSANHLLLTLWQSTPLPLTLSSNCHSMMWLGCHFLSYNDAMHLPLTSFSDATLLLLSLIHNVTCLPLSLIQPFMIKGTVDTNWEKWLWISSYFCGSPIHDYFFTRWNETQGYFTFSFGHGRSSTITDCATNATIQRNQSTTIFKII